MKRERNAKLCPADRPFALVGSEDRGLILTALNGAASRAGLFPGLGLADARAQAQTAAAAVAEKAHAEIEASKERFQREMALEAAKVKAEIRREAVELTLAAAGRVIGKSLNAADHARLAEEALRDAESVAQG